MIEMKVMGIAIDTATGSPIIVLNDKDNRKALPIWIGSAEASAIIRKIENIKVTRPMTHDLIIDIVEKAGYTIDRVEINDVENETYFSTIYLLSPEGKELEIDSRPSDAIAVAIRVDAPIFVSAKVLADGSVSCDSAKDEEESEEFRNFIQSIKPSDFEKLLKDDKQSDQ
ncbi:MAG: bifunctional nuclease family protein [Candidatus Avigastranaerophilus sp.]